MSVSKYCQNNSSSHCFLLNREYTGKDSPFFLKQMVRTNIASERCHKYVIDCLSDSLIANAAIDLRKHSIYLHNGVNLVSFDLTTQTVCGHERGELKRGGGKEFFSEDSVIADRAIEDIFAIYNDRILYTLSGSSAPVCLSASLKESSDFHIFGKQDEGNRSWFVRAGGEITQLDHSSKVLNIWHIEEGKHGQFPLVDNPVSHEARIQKRESLFSTKYYLICLRSCGTLLFKRPTMEHTFLPWPAPEMVIMSAHAKKKSLLYCYFYNCSFGMTLIDLETHKSQSYSLSRPFNSCIFITDRLFLLQEITTAHVGPIFLFDADKDETERLLPEEKAVFSRIQFYNRKEKILLTCRHDMVAENKMDSTFQLYDLSLGKVIGRQVLSATDPLNPPITAFFDFGSLIVAYKKWLVVYDYKLSVENNELIDESEKIEPEWVIAYNELLPSLEEEENHQISIRLEDWLAAMAMQNFLVKRI